MLLLKQFLDKTLARMIHYYWKSEKARKSLTGSDWMDEIYCPGNLLYCQFERLDGPYYIAIIIVVVIRGQALCF